MNTVKCVSFLGLLIFLWSATVYVPAADGQTVHALLVVMDDDPSIGRNVRVDKKRIQHMLDSVENELSWDVERTDLLSSEDNATRAKILEWVKNIRANPNDVVFIYYAGHGGMNRSKETFLATEGQYLYRKELVNALENVKLPRLTCLITDCCSSLAQSALDATLQSSRSGARTAGAVLKNLFLEHKGFLHLTSATEGQYAWSNVVNGGWFTMSLINAMEADPDGNRDRFLSWEEVFVKARENTEKLFTQTTFTVEQQARMRQLGITSQTPKAYTLPTGTALTAGAFFTIDGLREVNLIFAVVVLGTLAISGRISRKLKKQYAGRDRIAAQRNKAWAILFIEVVIWIGFNIFYEFSRANWLWIGIGGVVVIGIILSRKRKQYA
ncbi:caspase family protein [Candidatus Poribacteria bacterium]|nr:caspase family protein [Candidatus Poribacteria bacterium]MYA99429.1 caspase family protein [Candidatus Poribacteria bacterium]